MVRIQKKISAGLEVLQYFTTKKWIFHNNKIIVIHDELSPEDKKIFPTYLKDLKESVKMEYVKNIILGTRQYCLKEDLSSLPKARRHQKM